MCISNPFSLNHLFSPIWVSISTLMETKMEKLFAHERQKRKDSESWVLLWSVHLSYQPAGKAWSLKKLGSQTTHAIFPQDSAGSLIPEWFFIDTHDMRTLLVTRQPLVWFSIFFHSQSPSKLWWLKVNQIFPVRQEFTSLSKGLDIFAFSFSESAFFFLFHKYFKFLLCIFTTVIFFCAGYNSPWYCRLFVRRKIAGL